MLFFIGILCGFAIAVLWGLYLVAKPKPEPVKPTCHVASSGVESVPVAHARLLNHALEQAGHDKLFELPGQHTRH
jgi:hypothetical protein